MRKYAKWLSVPIAVGIVLIWHFSALNVSNLILPNPLDVFSVLIADFATGKIFPHLWTTLFEILAGLGTGGFLGFALGILLGEAPSLKATFAPFLVISQAVPKMAIAPLFMLWFGYGLTSKIIITALICFFPLLEASTTAISQNTEDQLALFKLMGANRWQTLYHLKIPTGMPTIIQGLRVAVVQALVGAIVGEFVGASQGLGAMIIASQGVMDTTQMFAVLIVLSVIGFGLYTAVNLIEIFVLRYK